MFEYETSSKEFGNDIEYAIFATVMLVHVSNVHIKHIDYRCCTVVSYVTEENAEYIQVRHVNWWYRTVPVSSVWEDFRVQRVLVHLVIIWPLSKLQIGSFTLLNLLWSSVIVCVFPFWYLFPFWLIRLFPLVKLILPKQTYPKKIFLQ